MYNAYNPYNSQTNIDRINNQIAELEKMRTQLQQPIQPSINQTFQLSANQGMRYANTIEDVNKEMVVSDTAFFSKDLSIVWIKNAKGDVKSYELTEIIQKDDKDIMIENLKYQIEELRKEVKNVATTNANDDVSIKNEKSTSVSSNRKSSSK